MTDQNFSDLSLSPALMDAVTKMGFTEMTGVQIQAIPAIRAGSDVLARSQTGTGKTVAFALPAVELVNPDERSIQVLVLSPTRELAKQCGDEFRKLAKFLPHVKVADIYGGADFERQFRELTSANVVVGTPGRVMDHMRRGTLRLDKLRMIVLDEADEMLDMGFKEDIETILLDVPEQRQILLFSATLPDGILAIARQFQHNPVHIDLSGKHAIHASITQTYVEVPKHRKVEALHLLLHYYKPLRCIIFANTKTMVDELTEGLSAGGFSVEGLHGDMKQLQRTTVMNGFKRGRLNILVATDVAARGIDVSDIDYVFNYDIPKVADYYVHRIGRTGRAGRDGTAITLCSGRDQTIQMRRLSNQVKCTITQVDLPTVADVLRSDRERDLVRIEKALAEQISEHHQEMLSQLLEKGHSPEIIAGAMITLAFPKRDHGLSDIKMPRPALKEISGRPLLKERDSRRPRETGSAPERGTRLLEKLRNRDSVDLVFDIGSANRVEPKHFVGAITERTGMSSAELGKIQIREDHSTVAVPADLIDEIMLAMRGCKICGRPVRMSPSAEPKRKRTATPAYRSPKTPYQKRK